MLSGVPQRSSVIGADCHGWTSAGARRSNRVSRPAGPAPRPGRPAVPRPVARVVPPSPPPRRRRHPAAARVLTLKLSPSSCTRRGCRARRTRSGSCRRRASSAERCRPPCCAGSLATPLVRPYWIAKSARVRRRDEHAALGHEALQVLGPRQPRPGRCRRSAPTCRCSASRRVFFHGIGFRHIGMPSMIACALAPRRRKDDHVVLRVQVRVLRRRPAC